MIFWSFRGNTTKTIRMSSEELQSDANMQEKLRKEIEVLKPPENSIRLPVLVAGTEIIVEEERVIEVKTPHDGLRGLSNVRLNDPQDMLEGLKMIKVNVPHRLSKDRKFIKLLHAK